MLRRAAFSLSLVLTASGLVVGQSAPITVTPTNGDATRPGQPAPPIAAPLPSDAPRLKPAELDERPALTPTTKMQLIRVLDAEFVHVRKYFPVGEKNMVIEDDGVVRPGDAELYKAAQIQGAAAKVGDRVQITNIVFRDKSIYFEINGGPKKKTKWYQHIEISGLGGTSGGVDPNGAKPTGAAITVAFKKHVPEMTGPELKLLLGPVLDFSVKTAAEVFVDTMPPKIKEAVKKHEILVGMNHDMVVMAKDRPQQKVREKDEQGRAYEEWIYGTAPQDVVFVRFIGDEVVQVKIAKVGGEIIVKTQKEVEVVDGVPTLAALKASPEPQSVSGAPQPDQPAHRPTLKRPDEQAEPAPQPAGGSTGAQGQDPHPDEPQWGTNGKQPAQAPQQTPDSSQQSPAEPAKQPPL